VVCARTITDILFKVCHAPLTVVLRFEILALKTFNRAKKILEEFESNVAILKPNARDPPNVLRIVTTAV
jgi:hypothetical protein